MISVNPMNYVIYVPKADLNHLGGVVYELDVDTFRMWLKAWEDDQEYGMYMPRTHDHNTEVSLSGITYARIVEVLDPYTVEFEDGQYIVSCTGANHNIGDVKVPNQVSLLINNAAGLISNPAIEYASFNGGVTIDVINGVAGTIGSTGNPIGTPRNPVNNTADALQIANNRGFVSFYILGDITLDSGLDYEQLSFIGESVDKTTITVTDSAQTEKCEFYECTLTGTLDGQCKVKNSIIDDTNYISGVIELCILRGTITLGGGANAYFLDCWAGTDLGTPPTVDLGGSGQTLVMQNFNGYIKWQNKTGSEQANASLNAGWVFLDSTITNGDINIIGTGTVEDNTTGSTVVNTTHLVDGGIIGKIFRKVKFIISEL